jgi:hypothetical protein
LTAEHIAGQALAVRTDERDSRVSVSWAGDGQVTESEGQMLPAVDQAVEAEHPSLGDVPVGQP